MPTVRASIEDPPTPAREVEVPAVKVDIPKLGGTTHRPRHPIKPVASFSRAERNHRAKQLGTWAEQQSLLRRAVLAGDSNAGRPPTAKQQLTDEEKAAAAEAEAAAATVGAAEGGAADGAPSVEDAAALALALESASPVEPAQLPAPTTQTPRSSGKLRLNTKKIPLGGYRVPSIRRGEPEKPNTVYLGNRTARGYATYRDPSSAPHVRNWYRFLPHTPRSSRSNATPRSARAGSATDRGPSTSSRRARNKSPTKSLEGLRAIEDIEQSAAVTMATTPRGTEVPIGGARAKQQFFEQFIDWTSDLMA